MTTNATDTTEDPPPWRGFHHVALTTPHLDETIGFYRDVLGMEVTALLPAREGRGRHCFIRPGATESWGLHFFERDDAQIFIHPEALQGVPFVPGALQHIAFALPDEAAAVALRARLEARGIRTTDMIDQGTVRLMLFADNNGMLLEATWPRA